MRVAGNFLETDGLASLEYTTAVLGTPLLVVLGHEKCGAVDAAIKTVKDGAKLPGHLPELVSHIKPAVKAVAARQYVRPSTPEEILAATIEENVRLNVEKLKTASPIVSKFVDQDKVRVVGGIYRLATGKVDFFV